MSILAVYLENPSGNETPLTCISKGHWVCQAVSLRTILISGIDYLYSKSTSNNREYTTLGGKWAHFRTAIIFYIKAEWYKEVAEK